MVHVDDLLFAGSSKFWREKFLPRMREKFSISYNELGSDGSSIAFLKRRIVKVTDDLLLVPGTSTGKVVKSFEKLFGAARSQKISCDPGIQQPDLSPELKPSDAKGYSSIVGLLLYMARDRLDIMFTAKELAAFMSKPTLGALQRLPKLVGFLKFTGDLGVKPNIPESGMGKWKQGGEQFWILETFTDADRSSNQAHRKSTSCGIHFINGSLVLGPSRTQKAVSLSSAESELHSMVSGCSDGMFIRVCLKFLVRQQDSWCHVKEWESFATSQENSYGYNQGDGERPDRWPNTHQVEIPARLSC